MPNEFNGNDVPAPEKSKKRKSTTSKARKSAAVTSDGAAATPAPVKKASPKNNAPKTAEPAAPEVQVPEVVATNLSTMPTPSPNNVHERIRARAYEIYVERGGQHGFDQSDWLQAEAEILGKLTA
ncbi:MAG TPA: DUF2934 domain-containing protein [Terriglobales bacterium]